MKLPHFSISTLMAIVALVALDFWIASRLFDDHRIVSMQRAELISLGILPMANLLALGFLPFLPRTGKAVSRPKRVGFEIFGASALAILLFSFLMMPLEIHTGIPQLLWFLDRGPQFLVGAGLLMLLPQLGLACLGAWIFGRYRIVSRWPSKSPAPFEGLDHG